MVWHENICLGTAVRQPNGWLLLLYQLTFPVPNDMATAICTQIEAFERSQSLRAQTAVADKAAADLLRELSLEEPTTSKGSKKKGKSKGK